MMTQKGDPYIQMFSPLSKQAGVLKFITVKCS